MLGNIALDKQDRFFRVNAASQVNGGHKLDPLPECFYVMRHGDSMFIHNTKIAVMLLLYLCPLLEGTDVITDMEAVGRLDAREDDILHNGHMVTS